MDPSFNESLDNFLHLSEQVLTHGGKQSGLFPPLKSYKAIYDKSREGKGHIELFTEVYRACRQKLLGNDSIEGFMEWYLNRPNGFVISPKVKSARSKIYLTGIFRECDRIASGIHEEAEHSDKSEALLRQKAAVFPEYYMLYLLRIFRCCANPSDRETILGPKISDLERVLGLKKDETASFGDSLTDLIELASEATGMNLPEGGLPDGANLRNIIQEIKGNPEIKSKIQSIFSGVDLNNVNGFSGTIQTVLNKMTEVAETLPEPVQRSMSAKADD